VPVEPGDRPGTSPVPARIDYAVRALLALAAAAPGVVTARRLAGAGNIPRGYVYDVLADLRRAGLVEVHHGAGGGYALARPATEVTVGAVLRLLDGVPARPAAPLPPRDVAGELPARLDRLWSAAAAASLRVLDGLTLADVVRGDDGLDR
jgi:Rrf2 family protein